MNRLILLLKVVMKKLILRILEMLRTSRILVLMLYKLMYHLKIQLVNKIMLVKRLMVNQLMVM